MKTYRIADGDTLTFSVNNGAWETITFKADDFQESKAAHAEELVNVLNRSSDLAPSIDEEGSLVLATATSGSHAVLEIDLARSSAAAALGLAGEHTRARGAGLEAARLVSRVAAPFALPLGAEMAVVVDGRRRRIIFDRGITAGKATAAEVVAIINNKQKGIARVSRDNRVMLTSPSVGVHSRLEIEGGRVDEGKIDAAAILGFVGTATVSQPYTAEPARLFCRSQRVGLRVVNLTASPIELHFPTGTVVLPARGSLPLLAGAETHGQVQYLIGQGTVRLMPATDN